MRVLVLGPVDVERDGRIHQVTSRAQRLVLATLAAAPNRVVSIGRLIDAIWADRPPESARRSLKSHVSRLRRTLGDDVISARAGGYVLDLDPQDIDAFAFERLVTPDASLDDLDQALGMWRGPPFSGVDTDVLAPTRVRLEALRTTARELRARRLAENERYADAVIELESITVEDPLREPVWIHLVQILTRAGRRNEAVQAASRYRSQVSAAGLEPTAAFIAVERRLFEAEGPVAAATSSRHEGGELVPRPRLSRFVGRDTLVHRVEEVLDAHRTATLVGPGGVGKTALADEIARRRYPSRHPDGVSVVPLADVDDDDGVLNAVARRIGAALSEPIGAAIAAHLHDRRRLVVLDCCEHVRRGAAEAARAVLSASEHTNVLLTSRRRIGIDGERVIAVGPLSSADAVELFCDRAEEAGHPVPSDAVPAVTRICDRLDRFPLPIEMAAARVPALGVEVLDRDLAVHLDTLSHSGVTPDERHQTLRAVEQWSYRLLEPDQRQLLDQIAIFPGDFDLSAAQAVHDAPESGVGTVHLVADLVGHSMILTERSPRGLRYRVPDTIKVAANDRLSRSGQARKTASRFVDHYRLLSQHTDAGLRGTDEGAWADRFDAEFTNIEAAHRRSMAHGDVASAIEISASTYSLVYQRLRVDVGSWAERCLHLLPDHQQHVAVAAVAALNSVNRGDLDIATQRIAPLLVDSAEPEARFGHDVCADIALYRGEFDTAVDHTRRCEEFARAADDHFIAMMAKVTRAVALGYSGNNQAAIRLLDAITPDDRRVSPLVAAWLDYARGEVLADAQPDAALSLVTDAAQRARTAGWTMLAGVAGLTSVSIRARTATRPQDLHAFIPVIQHWRRHTDWTHQITTLRNAAVALSRTGRHESAAILFGATLGQVPYGPEAERLAAAEDDARRSLGAAHFGQLHVTGHRLSRARVIDLALDALESSETGLLDPSS